MTALIKNTIKLLLRNKGFLFFLILTPVISTVLFGMKVDFELYNDEPSDMIIELESCTSRAVYAGDNYSFIIKVYDGSKTELSEYVLNSLSGNGMFSVCRADVSGMTYDDITAQVRKDAFDDHAGVILYLNDSFDKAVMEDRLADGMEIFITSDDEREELFETELSDMLSKIYRAGVICGADSTSATEMLDTISEKLPEKNVTTIESSEKITLTRSQNNSLNIIGYAFAFITLGFMFSGVFISHTIITESENKVFTRIMLSGTGTGTYFVSKFIVVILTSVLQTGVLAVCMLFLKDFDIGISLPVLLVVVLLLGIIISTFSMLTGTIIGDIMSATGAAFLLWSVSAMLSGSLFPIDDSAVFLKAVSYLTPQKWFLDVSQRLLAGLSGTYPMLLCVTAAYLIVIICMGSVGLKIKKQET